MEKGQVGVIIIIASLIFSVAGGFLFNTTDVTACGTDFTYVTDVTGAFTGTQGNLEIEHNPAENLSGYSVFNPNSSEFRSNTISGIEYTKTTPNTYWIQKSTGNPITQTVTISHNLSPNGGSNGVVTYNFGSGTNPTSPISSVWGLDNSEIRTVLIVNDTTHSRVAGITVYDLIDAYMEWEDIDSIDTNSVRIYFNSSIDAYPGFITNLSRNYIGHDMVLNYSNITEDILVNPTNGSVQINGTSYAWSEVYAVWGDSNSTQSSLTMVLGGEVTTEYINPLYGVKPIPVTVSDPTQEGDIVNANHVGGSLYVPPYASQDYVFETQISYKSDVSENYSELFKITTIFGANGTYSIIDENAHTLFSGNTQHGFTVDPITINWDWDSNNPTYVSMWMGSGDMPSNPITLTVNNIPNNGIYKLSQTYNAYGTNLTAVVGILTNKSTTPVESHSNTGGGNFDFVTTYALPLDITYTTTYWSNKVENSKIDIVFSKPSNNIDNVFFIEYKLTDGSTAKEPVRMGYNGTWFFYGPDNTPNDLGNWPGILLSIRVVEGEHSYVLTPLQTFSNFQSYTLINREYSYSSSTIAPDTSKEYQSITYMQFDNTGERPASVTISAETLYNSTVPLEYEVGTTVYIEDATDGGIYRWIANPSSITIVSEQEYNISVTRYDDSHSTSVTKTAKLKGTPSTSNYGFHEVVNTTIFIKDGGLYLNNGVFNPSESFPSDQIIKFRIMSAVRSGESITVTTNAGTTPISTTYLTNSLGTGLYIDGKLYPFNEVLFYYVSEDVPTVEIEGQTYAGGLYLNGQFFEKGHLYVVAGKNSYVVDLGITTNDWTIQLNGIWAISTAYYVGENKATSVVVWDQPGQWHWDANLTLIVFIGVNLLGLVLATRFATMSVWDWVMPICACVIAFVMIG